MSDYYLLTLDWAEAGSDFGDQWIGLADFSVDRWRWQPMTQSGVLPLGGEQYFSDDDAIVAVLCLGTDPWELAQLSLIAADAPDEVAPDFTLRLLESEEAVTLSSFRAQRPVVLLMGGYT